MNEFPHDRLDVYRAAVEFLVVVEDIVPTLPRGRAYLADQLRRASTSICLNIAEGSGEFAAADKARFYRFARRSSTECAAILDAFRIAGGDGGAGLARGKELLFRIASMLSAMISRLTSE